LSAIYSYNVCMTVVVRSAVTGPDSSHVSVNVPAHQITMPQLNMISHL